MINPGTLFLVIIVYVTILIALAAWGEKGHARREKISNSGVIYALSLAVYVSSWTFYGSIGKAANSGLIFLTVYIGPSLSIALWWIILRKFVRIKTKYHITSIADFLSARYNKSPIIALVVTIIAVIGIMPYISLQLKSIFSTFRVMISSSMINTFMESTSFELFIVTALILFVVVFGIRRLDPTSRHPGIMLAISAESVVKLVVFLIAGIFITFFLNDGFADIFSRISMTEFAQKFALGGNKGFSLMEWFTYLLLSMSAIFFLPRQFHVSVIENAHEKNIKTAYWLFPLYLFLINIFVMPVAAAGLLQGLNIQSADTFLLLLPFSNNQAWISVLVFIGGLSAATGMIMISTMTLSTMITNHIVLPITEKVSQFASLKRNILSIKWFAAAFIILLGYLHETNLQKTALLVNIGMIAFAAVIQFAPAMLAGIFWKRANQQGALYGMLAGFSVWIYTLLLPNFLRGSGVGMEILMYGPFGVKFFKPESLFGLTGLDALTNGVLWSLVFNLVVFVSLSLLLKQKDEEVQIAQDFVDILKPVESFDEKHELKRTISLKLKIDILTSIMEEYLPRNEVNKKINSILRIMKIEQENVISVMELAELRAQVERVLAGAVGAAAAYKVLKQTPLYSDEEAEQLSQIYTQIIAKMRESKKSVNNSQEHTKNDNIAV